MDRLSDLTKVKVWKVMSSSNLFWVTTIILYLQSRGIPLEQALLIVSIYSVLCVVFEYPTGIIGDYFSHKTSVILGTALTIIMFVFVTLQGNFSYYLAFGSILPALAFTLLSGSDTALLHSVSKNFKEDLAQITPISLFLAAGSITLGGLLAAIDLRLPFIASAIYALLSLPFLLTIKNYSYKRDGSNIFSIATGGIKDVFSSKRLRSLITISGAFGAFFVSMKWFYNPLFENLNIPVAYWGIITGVAFLFIAIGAQIYRRFDKLSLFKSSFLSFLSIILVGATRHWLLPLIGIWFVHIVRGYQDTHLGIEINEAIKTNRRASILSLNSLFVRLASAIYIASAAFVLPKTSFFVVMSATVLIIAVIIFKPLKNISKAND